MTAHEQLVTEFETIAALYSDEALSFLHGSIEEVNKDHTFPLILLEHNRTSSEVIRTANNGIPSVIRYDCELVMFTRWDETDKVTNNLDDKYSEVETMLYQFAAKFYQRYKTQESVNIFLKADALRLDYLRNQHSKQLISSSTTLSVYIDDSACAAGTWSDVLKPTNLVGVGAANAVSLTWTDNSSNEANFILQRTTDVTLGPWVTILSPAAGATSATDSTAVSNVHYFYRLAATDGTITSSWSNITGGVRTATGITVDFTTLVDADDWTQLTFTATGDAAAEFLWYLTDWDGTNRAIGMGSTLSIQLLMWKSLDVTLVATTAGGLLGTATNTDVNDFTGNESNFPVAQCIPQRKLAFGTRKLHRTQINGLTWEDQDTSTEHIVTFDADGWVDSAAMDAIQPDVSKRLVTLIPAAIGAAGVHAFDETVTTKMFKAASDDNVEIADATALGKPCLSLVGVSSVQKGYTESLDASSPLTPNLSTSEGVLMWGRRVGATGGVNMIYAASNRYALRMPATSFLRNYTSSYAISSGIDDHKYRPESEPIIVMVSQNTESLGTGSFRINNIFQKQEGLSPSKQFITASVDALLEDSTNFVTFECIYFFGTLTEDQERSWFEYCQFWSGTNYGYNNNPVNAACLRMAFQNNFIMDTAVSIETATTGFSFFMSLYITDDRQILSHMRLAYGDSGGANYVRWIYTSQKLYVYSGGSGFQFDFNDDAIRLGGDAWTTVFVTCETNGDCRAFIGENESLDGVGNIGTNDMYIERLNYTNEYFQGFVARWEWFDSPMSAGEITAAKTWTPNAANDNASPKLSPVRAFRFNQGFSGVREDITIVDEGSDGANEIWLTTDITNGMNLVNGAE